MAPPHPAHHTPPSLPCLLSPRGFLGSFLQLPPSITPHHAEESLASSRAFGKDGPPNSAVSGAGQPTGQRLQLISMGSRFNRLTGAIHEMVHACLLIDTLLSATPTCSQLFSLVEVRRVYPWLAMLRDRLTNTTDAYQLNRLRTAERPTGLIV